MKLMMQSLSQVVQILAISALCCEALAGQSGLTIKTIKRQDWQFPVLVGPNPQATERMNSLMLINAFDLEFPVIPPRDPEQSLSVLNDEMSHSISAMDFQELRNDGRIFSVLFNAEGCGAYCEPFDRPVAFDATSGRLLSDLDLFTDAGRNELIKEIVQRNQKAIQDQLGKIKSTKPSEYESPDDLGIAIDMYKECLEQWQSPDWQNGSGKMEFHQTELIFVHGRCSNHALQGLDDLGDLRTRFPYESLKPWLSNYGRRILLGENSDAKPVSALGQWLTGTIGGKARITLYIRQPYGEYLQKETDIHGYYFYDKYRKPLKIEGKWKDNKYFLEEFGDGETAQASLLLENDGSGGLRGKWKSRDGKKILEVIIDP